MHVEAPRRVRYFLVPDGLHGLNLRTWQQVPLPAEPSCQMMASPPEPQLFPVTRNFLSVVESHAEGQSVGSGTVQPGFRLELCL